MSDAETILKAAPIRSNVGMGLVRAQPLMLEA